MRPEPGTYFTVPQATIDSKLPEMGGAATKVFLYLCRHADSKSGECFRSQTTIAQGCGFSPRTTREAITELVHLRAIESKNRGQQSNLYTIPYPAKSCRLEVDLTGEKLPDTTGEILPVNDLTGEISPSNRRNLAAYQTSLSKKKEESACASVSEPKKKPARGKKSKPKQTAPSFDPLAVALPFDSAEFKEAWGDWVSHRNEKKKPLTPTTTKQQLKKLRGLGEKAAINLIELVVEKGWIGLDDHGKAKEAASSEKPRMATDEELASSGYTRR